MHINFLKNFIYLCLYFVLLRLSLKNGFHCNYVFIIWFLVFVVLSSSFFAAFFSYSPKTILTTIYKRIKTLETYLYTPSSWLVVFFFSLFAACFFIYFKKKKKILIDQFSPFYILLLRICVRGGGGKNKGDSV